MRHVLGLFVVLAAAAGCGQETDPRPASFAYITEAILKPSCGTATCHSSLNQRQNIILDNVDDAYPEIRGASIPGSGVDSPIIVDYLTSSGDKRMPYDSPLPDPDIDLIIRWIDDGARNN